MRRRRIRVCGAGGYVFFEVGRTFRGAGTEIVYERYVTQGEKSERNFSAPLYYLDFRHFRDDFIFGIEKDIQ